MAQPPEQGCGICRDLKRRTMFSSETVVFSEKDLFDIPSNAGKKKKKELKKQKAEEFLKYVNAFMNEGGGIVCLHVKNIHLLGIFEQTVNPSMAGMIPDGSTFPENFERHLLGKNHVVFRVKPRTGLLSTYSFNTKISLDCGVEDAGHEQMRYLMKPQEDTDVEELYKVYDFKFREGEDVVVKIRKTNDVDGKPHESVFQESKNIQVKRVMNTESTFESILESDFFDERKTGTYLPKYISAFSKLLHGGSIFLGIIEGKTKTSKWLEVDEGERSRVLELKDQSLHLWKDNYIDTLYYVAKECPKDDVESGAFKCEGIQLKEAERETVLPTLKRLIKEKMFWLPHQNTEQSDTDFPDLVSVHFHDVEGAVDKVVVEIQVKRYQGVAFLTTDGPRAYCFAERSEGDELELKTVEMDMWSKKLCKADIVCGTDRDLSSSTGLQSDGW